METEFIKQIMKKLVVKNVAEEILDANFGGRVLFLDGEVG